MCEADGYASGKADLRLTGIDKTARGLLVWEHCGTQNAGAWWAFLGA